MMTEISNGVCSYSIVLFREHTMDFRHERVTREKRYSEFARDETTVFVSQFLQMTARVSIPFRRLRTLGSAAGTCCIYVVWTYHTVSPHDAGLRSF